MDGITFAHLSFTYGFNGASLPPGQPWRSNLLSADAVIAQARDARARGAQVVIASLHWGNEGSNVITPEQRTIAEQVTASGQVDLIVGHHVHVAPADRAGQRPLGGLRDGQHPVEPADADRAGVAGVDAGRDDRHAVVHPLSPTARCSVSRPMVVPTWVDKNDRWLIRPVQQDLVDPDVPAGHPPAAGRLVGPHDAVVGEYLATSSRSPALTFGP